MASIRLTLAAVLVASLSWPIAPADAGEEDKNPRVNRTVKAVRKARAAVVSIKTPRVIESRWFPFMRSRPQPEGAPTGAKPLGSGVIFHPSGFVITNAHVISEADQILVDVSNGEKATEFAAVAIAVDLPNDLAVLRLVVPDGEEALSFPHLRLGRSDDLMLGETVIAIGHPLRLGLTVSRGIISGLNRNLGSRGGYKFDDFIQLDAPINLGNSGGPLMDVTGRWIGVNSAFFRRGWASTAEGIGFAIPANRVRSLVAKAFRRRVVTGTWFGLELEEGDGGRATIAAAYPKGPAGEARVRKNDVILAVDGVSTPTLYDVRMKLIALPPESSATFWISRDGKRIEDVVITEEEDPTEKLSLQHLGFVAEESHFEGLRITTVRPGSPAAEVKLQRNDVLMALGPFRIKTRDDLLRFLQFVHSGDLVDVRVNRFERAPGGRARIANLKGSIEAE